MLKAIVKKMEPVSPHVYQKPRHPNLKNQLLTSLVAAVVSLLASQGAAEASTWYVSKLATGSVHDGTSWSTAWTDFGGSNSDSRIDWSQVQPGDSIQIDAGSNPGATVTYTTPLVVQKSNLQISIPGDAAHTKGLVVLQTPSGKAIDLTQYAVQNVTIEGSKWLANTSFYMPGVGYQSMKFGPNLRISSTNGTGIAIGPNATSITLRNLHLINNQIGMDLTGGTTYGYYLMLNQNAYNIRSIPNASAVGQSAYLYYSWLFNANPNIMPTSIYCAGNPASSFDLNFYYSIIGPNFYNGIITTSTADSVKGAYTLFLNNSTDLTCSGAPRMVNLTYDIIFKTPMNRWNLGNSNLNFTESDGTTVMGTIVRGGSVVVNGSNSLGAYNKQFNTTGNTLVLSASQEDPQFASGVSGLGNNPSFYTLTTLDLTPANGTPGSPYCIHSVDDLYSRVPKGN